MMFRIAAIRPGRNREAEVQAARRATRVLDFIKRYKVEHDGVAPTLREIGDACDISSTSMTAYYLERLEEQAVIRLAENGVKTRSIEVVGGRWTPPEE